MNNCFKCGISDEKSMLYDAISDEGIIKVCRKCSFEENLPLIKKINEQEKRDRAIAEANSFELRKKLKQTPIRKTSVYNRLVSMSGITPVEKIEKSEIDKVFVSDSINITKKSKKVEIVSVSELIADSLVGEL